jgi:hypothetical protein
MSFGSEIGWTRAAKSLAVRRRSKSLSTNGKFHLSQPIDKYNENTRTNRDAVVSSIPSGSTNQVSVFAQFSVL